MVTGSALKPRRGGFDVARLGEGARVSFSFDVADPPQEPPVECVDPLTWRLAYSLHTSHRPKADDFCSCGRPYPCTSARLAERGFRVACGGAGPAEPVDADESRVGDA